LEPTGKFNEESSLKFELIMMLLFLTNVDDNNIMIFCVLILFLPNGDEELVCKLKFHYYDYYL